jgi:uncharacterized membrane protein
MNKRNIALSGIVLIILFAFAVLAWLGKNEPEKQENKQVELRLHTIFVIQHLLLLIKTLVLQLP